MLASGEGHSDVVTLLLAADADIRIENQVHTRINYGKFMHSCSNCCMTMLARLACHAIVRVDGVYDCRAVRPYGGDTTAAECRG
jgi:hypothetical protein